MARPIRLFGLLILVAALFGCASTPREIGPPYADVDVLQSTVMTPEIVKFTAKVVVYNQTASSIDFDRVDYAVDLYDSDLFTDSFADLPRTRSGHNLTITLPFQIAVSDITDSLIDLLDEEVIRVSFHGDVYPASDSGYGALTIDSVESYLEINDHRYPLLYTKDSTQIDALGSGIVSLAMEQTPGRTNPRSRSADRSRRGPNTGGSISRSDSTIRRSNGSR